MSPATIGRLRISADRADSVITPLRAAAVLETMSFAPIGLPPAAILCIRSLRDPRPRSLQLHTSDPVVAQSSRSAWQAALTQQLDDLAARAVRPFVQAVPPTAEAVLFVDESELLACLARDWLAGRLGACWWWSHLLNNLSHREMTLRAWYASPNGVPAAMTHLANSGIALMFVRDLAGPEVQHLTRLVLERFALEHLQSVLASSLPSVRTTAVLSTAGVRSSRAVEPPAASPSTEYVGAPWHRLAPPDAIALSAEQQFLLGVCLSLTYQNSITRT